MTANAQSIGIVGDFSSWGNDVVMSSSDNTNFTLSNYTFLVSGSVKFRQDAAWTNNWGSTSFPGGVGTPGGSNIPVPAGTYDITFNITTGAYMFTAVSTSYDAIGMYGGFNTWATPSEPLVTGDGISYAKIDFNFTAAGVKFIKDNNTTLTWGGTAFPSGTATAGGATIPLTVGYYNVDFNKNTLAYNFVQVPVSLIGDGISDWSTDVDMVSTDGGISFTLNNQMLMAGSVKFRTNYSWATNWGGTTFPTGTGALGSSSNITVDIPGTYNITFNRVTGNYVFTLLAASYASTTFNGSMMTTTDGVNYTLNNAYFAAAATSQFADPNAPTNVWGATSYPAGTAVQGSTNMIPVPAGYYNITFNRTTGDYAFTVSQVSLIGDFNSWADTAMNTSDNGLTFTASGVVLTGTNIKFRANGNWTLSWGGTTFPSGIADFTAGSPNIPCVAGTYDVSFNRTTAAYSFQIYQLINFQQIML